jgi:nucleoporin NUP1
MFQSREKAKRIVYMKNEKSSKPRLGMANRYPAIVEQGSPKPATPDRAGRDAKAKPYAGASTMKKLLAKRRQEEKNEHDQVEEDDQQGDESDGSTKHESKIPAPPRPQAVNLSRKLSAPIVFAAPVSSFDGRLSTSKPGRAGNAGRSVGPMRRKRGRFSAADDDDDYADEAPPTLGTIAEHVEPVQPKYTAPPGFTFAVRSFLIFVT